MSQEREKRQTLLIGVIQSGDSQTINQSETNMVRENAIQTRGPGLSAGVETIGVAFGLAHLGLDN